MANLLDLARVPTKKDLAKWKDSAESLRRLLLSVNEVEHVVTWPPARATVSALVAAAAAEVAREVVRVEPAASKPDDEKDAKDAGDGKDAKDGKNTAGNG